jgi:hypothetical protein
MKKIVKITLKAVLGLILLVLILLFTVPVIFKNKIRTKVETVINESVNAKVTFSDYKLTFFRNFPNLSFSLKNMYVVGVDKFQGDTLAGFKSFDLVFNLGSLFGSKGYEIKSMILDEAVINGIVLKDGKANWDIEKPSATPAVAAAPTTAPAATSSESGMKLQLKKVEIRNSTITYTDAEMNLSAAIKKVNFLLTGDMTGSLTDLKMKLSSGETTVIMDNVKYLNKVVIDSKVDMKANLDSLRFTFGDNYFSVNDMKLNFSGTVAMPKDDIITNLKFGTGATSFKTLLSLVPAVYMSGYESLKASGDFKLAGEAVGVYSDKDSTMPDIKLNMSVNKGLVSYPDLPEKISNIGINADLFYDGKKDDRSTFSVDKFHFELAGSPFDMTLKVKTPFSDPDFSGSMKGRIDLTALTKAVPMPDMNLSGIIDMAMTMAGKMSMIEKEKYESFTAKGTMGIKNMKVVMKGYPDVEIREAAFLFTPAFAQMQKADIIVAGKSDFSLSGNLMNYIPYVFKNETIKGSLTMHSNTVDLTSIFAAMPSDTATVPEDTTALAVIAVPKNIDFDFAAGIDKFLYGTIAAESLKGHLIVRDGILTIKEAGMNILGGTIGMNAVYDTRDTMKPVMKADIKANNIGVKDAYKTFVTIQKFAPNAKNVDGKVNLELNYESLLGRDMMPVIPTINGAGKLHSDQVQLLESATFDKMKNVLKLGDKYSNTFKDINVSFTITKGRVYVKPFDVKLGSIKMNVSGDQGLDQTLNYLVKTEIPRSELGSGVNALMDNLTSQASKFGLSYKPADIIKVNVRVKGTVTKPEVVPDFGGGSGSSSSPVVSGPVTKETVKQTVSTTIDNNREQIVAEAEKRAKQIRDEAATQATNIRTEADSSAAKLIRSAQSKGFIAKTAAQKGADALKKEADKKANQLIQEADKQATKLVEEAKTRK